MNVLSCLCFSFVIFSLPLFLFKYWKSGIVVFPHRFLITSAAAVVLVLVTAFVSLLVLFSVRQLDAGE